MKSREVTPEKFWRRVIKSNGCWEWGGKVDKAGYGRTNCIKKNMRAHRVAWMITHGDPGTLLVCHKCDNPKCVRPSHLFLGTAKDNAHDALKKGHFAIGEKNGRARLAPATVLRIRKLHKTELISFAELAKAFSVSKATVAFVVRRRNWKHL